MFLKLYLSSLTIGKFVEYSGALYLLISIVSLPIKRLSKTLQKFLAFLLIDAYVLKKPTFLLFTYTWKYYPISPLSVFECVSWWFTWTNTILRSVVLYSPIKNTVLKSGFMYVLTQMTRFLLWSLFSCGNLFVFFTFDFFANVINILNCYFLFTFASRDCTNIFFFYFTFFA